MTVLDSLWNNFTAEYIDYILSDPNLTAELFEEFGYFMESQDTEVNTHLLPYVFCIHPEFNIINSIHSSDGTDNIPMDFIRRLDFRDRRVMDFVRGNEEIMEILNTPIDESDDETHNWGEDDRLRILALLY